MQTDRRVRRGFTLIELLTVIAIIGILAGLTAAGLTRAIHQARMTEMYNRMGNVEDLLYIYYTENGTFPPAYGYINPDTRDVAVDCLLDGDPTNDLTPREDPTCLNPTNVAPPDAEDLPRAHFFLSSYMRELGQANNKDLYDPWSDSYDTDGDGRISYLEYLPLEDRELHPEDILYEDGTIAARNNPSGELRTSAPPVDEIQELLNADMRPFIYIPVNRRQAERVGQWYFDNLGANPIPDEPDDAGDINDTLQEDLANFSAANEFSEIPPGKYDAFVLMSVGPSNNTYGLLRELTNMVDVVNNYPQNYRYHILGHLLYFMMTRDADDNGKFDFTFEGRKDLDSDEQLYFLPDPNFIAAPGPPTVVSSR